MARVINIKKIDLNGWGSGELRTKSTACDLQLGLGWMTYVIAGLSAAGIGYFMPKSIFSSMPNIVQDYTPIFTGLVGLGGTFAVKRISLSICKSDTKKALESQTTS